MSNQPRESTIEAMRLASGLADPLEGKSRPPRHSRGEAFLKGPIPWDWWAAACRLPGHSLHVASAIRFLAGCKRADSIALGLSDMERTMGVKRDAARRALRLLESTNLISASYRSGCKPSATVREAALADARRRRQRSLRGPIPWAWWVRAARLPGRALHVASALWYLVGTSGGTMATHVFGLADWAELGLTRQSAGRGLRRLETAGLVTVARRCGGKADVTLQNIPAAPRIQSAFSELLGSSETPDGECDAGLSAPTLRVANG
jgi:hypothetical protein